MTRMAGDRLKVDDDEIIEKANNLAQAIVDYRELGENPLAEPLEFLNSMNSSFTERLGRMLGSLTATNPDVLENMEAIQNAATDIARNIRQVDINGVRDMGGI